MWPPSSRLGPTTRPGANPSGRQSLARDLEASRAEVILLQARVETLQARADEADRLEADLHSVRSDLDVREAGRTSDLRRIEQLEAEVGRLGDELRAALAESDRAGAHASELEADRDRLDAERSELASVADDLRAHLVEREDALDRATREHEEVRSSWEAELQAKRTAWDDQRQDLIDKALGLEARLSEAHAKLEEADRAAKEFGETFDRERTTRAADLERLQLEADSLRTERDGLTAGLEQAEAAGRDLEERLRAEVAALGVDLEAARRESESTGHRSAELEAEAESLRADRDRQAGDHADRLDEAKHSLDRARRDLEGLRVESDAERRRAADAAVATGAEHERHLAQARDLGRVATERADHLEAELQTLARRVNELDEQLRLARTPKHLIRSLLGRIGISSPSDR